MSETKHCCRCSILIPSHPTHKKYCDSCSIEVKQDRAKEGRNPRIGLIKKIDKIILELNGIKTELKI